MHHTKTTTSRRRKWLRAALLTLCVPAVLLGIALLVLQIPAVQHRITRETETWLNGKLGTRVEIGAIRLRFPYYVALEGFLLEDQRGDTLARIGNLVVDIGMWKLLDHTVRLQKIVLEDADVRLNYRDSTYNFDFIAKSFSNSDKPASTDTTASAWHLQLDPASIALKQVNFQLNDADAGTVMLAKIGKAQMDITGADLATMQFDLDNFILADTDFRWQQSRKSPDNSTPAPAYRFRVKNGKISRSHVLYATNELYVETTLGEAALNEFVYQSAADIQSIQTGQVRITDSGLIYRDPKAKPSPDHLNAGDLVLTRLDADVSSFSYKNDTLAVQATKLQARDKSGVEVHAMQAFLRVTPGSIEVQNAVARLNQTSLAGNAVLYNNDNAEFDRMDIQISQANGNIGDVLRAIPPLETETDLSALRDMPFEVAGTFVGSLQNLQTQNIRFRAAGGTVADFSGAVQNLDNIDKLGMQLNISRFETTRTDMIQWMRVGGIPADSARAMLLPAFVNATGRLDGTLAHLTVALDGAAGALQSGPAPAAEFALPLFFNLAGTLSSLNHPDRLNMDMTLNRLEAPRSFFTQVNMENIRLPDVLTAKGALKGSLSDLQIDLHFQAIRGYASSNLALTGALKNLRSTDSLGFDVDFKGELAGREIRGYLPDSSVNRRVNFPDKIQIAGRAKGTVRDLRANTTLGLNGLGEIELAGTLRDSSYNVDLRAYNLHVGQLAADTVLRPMKTLGMTAQITGTGFQFGQTARFQLTGKLDSLIWENLVLRDIVFNAGVDGKKFTAALQSPDERAAIAIQASGDFTTPIPLLEADIALNCIDLREFGWSTRPATVCMHLHSLSEGLSTDTLTAHVTIDNIDIQYDTVHVRPGDLTLDVNLDNHSNRLTIASDWLEGEIKGYFSIADLPATLNNIAEQYFIVDRLNYVAPVGTDSLSVELHLLRPELLTSGLIPGLTELEAVSIEGLLDARRNYFDFNAEVSRLVYADWSVDSLKVRAYAADTAALLLISTPQVHRLDKIFVQKAVLNGRLIDNSADLSFTARDEEGRERFSLAANAELSNGAKEIVITLAPQQTIDFQQWTADSDNEIRITGNNLTVKDLILEGNGQSIKIEGVSNALSGDRRSVDFTVDIDRLNYENFDLFVIEYVREMQGWMAVKLKIGGTTDALELRGKLQLHETAFTPVLNNVRYQLSETPLEFTSEGIVVDGLTLRDPYGKTLAVNGKLTTTDWQNIRTDLTLQAEKWQVLNTTKQQNGEYFGKVFVTLNGTVRGPASQPEIRLIVKTAKESNFTYIYDVATETLQHEGIVVFVQPQRQNTAPPAYSTAATGYPFSLSASLEIDSNLTIHSVINPVTGDDFNGTAQGKLQFDLYPNGNMNLSGRVELVQGIYNYSYQSVVSRSFKVASGSSIIWSGEVGNPELAIKAQYVFQASPYPLVFNQLLTATPEEAAVYRNKQTFYLQTSIDGTPDNPDIHFAFIYPSDQKSGGIASGFGSSESSLVTAALANVNEDPNALSRQVFGVLLMRNFIGTTLLPGAVVNGDPLRAGLNNFLTGQINALADQYLSWIDIDVEAKDVAAQDAAGQAQNTTDYQLRLQKSFFDDRLTFKVSGGTSVDATGTEIQSGFENASIEYSLTPDGSLRVKLFSEKGFELLNASASSLRNSGAGIVATKEFDSRRKRRNKQK